MNEPIAHVHDALADTPSLRDEVLRGFALHPKRIPPKFFYDHAGSELFDAICRLPEYYLTRTEIAILKQCGPEVARLAGPETALIELGSGAIEKVRLLLDVLRPAAYIAVDISREFLGHATRRLAADYPWLPVHAVCADFSRAFTLAPSLPDRRRLAFFPGSSIGNFDPEKSVAFLARLQPVVGDDGAIVIGVDLKKDPALLHAAYNDSQGVTAAFNLNLLRRIERELAAEIDIDGFAHEALYNEAAGRIEMYLVARRAQDIVIEDRRFRFAAGERLHTENSYKYTVTEFQALARRAGYRPRAVWTDPRGFFSVHYIERAGR